MVYGTLTQLRRNLENFVKVYFLLVINVGLKYSFLTTLESLLICFKFHTQKKVVYGHDRGRGKQTKNTSLFLPRTTTPPSHPLIHNPIHSLDPKRAKVAV